MSRGRTIISFQNLVPILIKHREWIVSGGKDGKRANLSNFQIDPKKINLARVYLPKAILHGADLKGADLREANLQGATLHEAEFKEANVAGADFRDALGLGSAQFGGAITTGAEFSEGFGEFKFQAKEASNLSLAIFLPLVLGCIYCLITVLSTTDLKLIKGARVTNLPFFNTDISIAGFYWIAPFLLLVLYFFFNFYLEKVWGDLARLPAIFPDGRRLDQIQCSWIPMELVRGHLEHLKKNRPCIPRLQSAFAIFWIWAFVPGGIFVFWFKYIQKLEFWYEILLYFLLTAFGAFFACYFLGRWIIIFLGSEAVSARWGTPNNLLFKFFSSLAVILIIAQAVISGFVLFGPSDNYIRTYFKDPADLVGENLQEIFLPGVDLQKAKFNEADLRKAVLWHATLSGSYFNMANLSEANLKMADLQWAKLPNAILFMADLQGADLRGAVIEGADLNKAKLDGADLQGADFKGAFLQEASLQGAKLQEANLKEANLQGAVLQWAKLQEADLQGASLRGAHLSAADFEKALLQRADLYQADAAFANFQSACVENAIFKQANLYGATFTRANLRGAIFQQGTLQWAVFENADLQEANFLTTDLRGANLKGANLRGAYFNEATKVTDDQLKVAKCFCEAKLPEERRQRLCKDKTDLSKDPTKNK